MHTGIGHGALRYAGATNAELIRFEVEESPMKRALQVAWFTVRAVYDELFVLGGMGLIWFLATLAAPYGVLALLGLLSPLAGWIGGLLALLVLAPPATGGIYHVASYIAREKRIEFGYYWEGVKATAPISWVIGGIVVASGAILVVDVVFYLTSENTIFAVVGFLGLWALLFWLTVQVYLLPLAIMQEDKRIKVILKNASLLTLAYPFFALVTLVIAVLTAALSVAVVVLLVTVWMPFVAVLFSRATRSSLDQVEDFRRAQAELEQEREE
jgi:uncharacterized membrane protein YesL